MDSLSQLFNYKGESLVLPFLPLKINDEPRYGYRGLLLDVSRHFYPIDTLKMILDGMRYSKINVLHLHLSDDDSIPVQFPSFPDMTDYTAFTKDEVYSQDDIKELVEYAENNGIKVIPEFDVPGHTRAIGDHPDFTKLMTCMGLMEIWEMADGSHIHGGPARAVLNPTLNETYDFIDKVLGDFATLFPKADFYHLGGDEVLTEDCWVQDSTIKAWMNENGISNGEEMFLYFQDRVGELAKQAKKQTAHWVYDDNFDLRWDEGSILQYWGDEEHIEQFKQTYPDHQHILSVHDYFYFDCGLGNRYGGSLCNPYQTWAKIRTFEPTQFYDADDDRLLGGEGCMWSELNNPDNVFNKIWPRLGVISSIFWSPKLETPFNWGNIVEELVKFRDGLRENGIAANQVSSRYCEMNPHIVFENVSHHEPDVIQEIFENLSI